jgi:dipeptidyl aminopeptidase/acylaminoacyl peptidase
VAQDAVGYYADVSGYDWSPDGTHVVYAASDGLYIAQASDGATGQLLTVSGATSPRWSPVQANGRTQILFGVGGGHNGRIDRVNDDGSGWIAVIPALPHKDKNEARISPNSARWSPAGSHFVYRVEQYKFSLLPESTAIDRAAADGSGKTVLISVVRWCVPLGWVSP